MNQIMKTNELNILCMGELTSEKSDFLQFYTSSCSSQNYKIFAHHQKNIKNNLQIWEDGDNGQKSWMIFLHQIEELDGIDVYLKYPFDAILFFVKIDQFHNTAKNILDMVQLYSRVSGINVYKIPLRIVAVSNKTDTNYDSISRGDKMGLCKEISHILLNDNQVIFVEFNGKYKEKLSRFYKEIIKGITLGIKESAYTNWYFRGIENYFSCGQLKLTFLKLFRQINLTIRRRKGKSIKGNTNTD